MEKLIINSTITINAAPEKVWEVLIKPAYTKVYMFGCETVSDWKVGSPLIWKMKHEGKDFIPVKGEILALEAPKLLKYTVIDPHAAYPDIPENYLNVTYTLEEQNGKTVLTIS